MTLTFATRNPSTVTEAIQTWWNRIDTFSIPLLIINPNVHI